jgi:hypothetical protein
VFADPRKRSRASVPVARYAVGRPAGLAICGRLCGHRRRCGPVPAARKAARSVWPSRPFSDLKKVCLQASSRATRNFE